jgi:DNA-binding MarR family transcriptional regulator
MALTDYDCLRITHALFNLTRAYEVYMSLNPTLRSSGLTIQDFAILIILAHEPITSRQLATMMDISPGMASIYVQRFVERGLLRKEQDRDDRRNWWLFLTEEGRHIHEAIIRFTVGFTRELLSSLEEGEQDALSSLLSKTLQRVGEIVPQLSDRSRIY